MEIIQGIRTDVSSSEYHHGPGISKSGLDLINLSPLHYKTYREHPKQPTRAFEIGSAFHKIVLEPDDFWNEYCVVPADAPKKPTAAQINAAKPSAKTIKQIAWWDEFNAENEGKLIITNTPGKDRFWNPGDYDRIMRMKESIENDPILSLLLNPTDIIAESSVYWFDQETKRLCKCKPDARNIAHNCIVDLKSTQDASFTEFSKSMGKYRYHVQDAFYSDGLRAVGEPVEAFFFVAVESNPPYCANLLYCSQEQKRVGRIEYRRNLDTFNECKKADNWPGYPIDFREADIPGWALKGRIK